MPSFARSWPLLILLMAPALAPTATADDVRVVVYCNETAGIVLVPGVACGATVKQTDRSCQAVVAGVGPCLYTAEGVGVGGYVDQALIPTVCSGASGEDCYGAQAGHWIKDGIYSCVVRVETPGNDLEPCVTFY